MEKRFPCACCGYMQFEVPADSDEICKICFYQDDFVDIAFPTAPQGPNRVSLIEAQENFVKFGASEWRLREFVRKPTQEDVRDGDWRPIDKNVDAEWLTRIEKIDRGELPPPPFPKDTIRLYYWRTDFWLRSV